MRRVSSWMYEHHMHLPAMIGIVIGHAAFLTTFVWLFG